jgi:Protein of unknown function (DUF2848)
VGKNEGLHPIGRHLWPIAEVSAHWDRLIARSWTTRGGERERYQERPLALMLHPDDLIHSATLWTADGSVLGPSCFAGRSAQRPPCHAELFEMEFEDPVLGRRIRHHYKVAALAVLA